MSDYPYTIPEGAVLVKTGLYYHEKVLSAGTLRTLYADYGWAIYDVAEMNAYLENPDENFISYSYQVILSINDSINNYDVCEITEGMEVYGQPNQNEVM